MNKSILFTKPLKTLPEVLLYANRDNASYTMLNVKNSKIAGRMTAYPIYNKKQDSYLFIETLNVYQQRRGFGTKFIEFAKKLSLQKDCGGRIKLIASATELDPQNPPHIFYRKNGFSCYNKKVLKKIDSHILKNKQLPYKKTFCDIMYYPPEPEKERTFFSRFKNLLKDYFNIFLK